MPDFQLTTPVAFIIFNRLDTAERVFAEIAKAKPPKLLVISDGARTNKIGESEKVNACREIIKRVDWDCEVLTNFSEVNLGCKRRVSSGIDWVFEQVEEAIILEDDCLPDPTFFRFCQDLLEKYRYDKRISMISGDNFQFDQRHGNGSYYFSRYPHIWGWASWRRAWQHYDVAAQNWPSFHEANWLNSITQSPTEKKYWESAFQGVYDGHIDTWDYQWVLTSWSQGMVSVMPNVNLISNIGFGAEATHTKEVSIFSEMRVQPIEFPLTHPSIVRASDSADAYTSKAQFSVSSVSFSRKAYGKLKAILHSLCNKCID